MKKIVSYRMFYPALLLVIPLVFAPRCHGQEDRADAFIREQIAQQHVPGLSVAIVRTGTVVFARGYGLANLENSVATATDAVYLLGSVTKAFTATAIMRLAEEGKIELEQPFTNYLKDLSLPDQLGLITVRQLLSHTSGITDFKEIPGSVQYARSDRLPKEVLREALALPLLFKPGAQYRYSNSNYILLGMIIERIAQVRFGLFLEERFFRPLQMNSTRMQNLGALIPKRVAGYHWSDGEWRNAEYISPANLYAAGGALSTVLDLATWDQALYTGKIVKAATLDRMLSAAVLANGDHAPYGLGLELLNDRGHRVAGHAGEVCGFNATWYHYLDDHLTVILLANQGDAPTEFLAKSLAAIYLGLPQISYRNRPPLSGSDPKSIAMLTQVLQGAAKGVVNETLFTGSAGKELVPLIAKAGPELLAAKGALKGIELLERTQEAENLVMVFRARFSHENLIWTMRVTKEGKIAALEPQPE